MGEADNARPISITTRPRKSNENIAWSSKFVLRKLLRRGHHRVQQEPEEARDDRR